MGDYSDTIVLGSLTAVSGSGNGPAFDLSSYQAGLLSANFSVAGTTLTPVFQISDDNGTTWVTCPTGILAAPAAIVATGVTWYQFVPAALALPSRCRMSWGSVTGSFTGTFRAFMRR
jgi:hypothetical protein